MSGRWKAPGAAAGFTGLVLTLALVPAVRAPILHQAKEDARAMGLNIERWGRVRHGVVALASFGAGAPAASAVTAAAPPLPAMPVPPTILAINVAPPVWFNLERSFANLAIGATWQYQGSQGWADAPPENVSRDGTIRSLPGGRPLTRILTAPDTGAAGLDIRCTFSGRGTLIGGGVVSRIENGANSVRFHFVNKWEPTTPWLTVNAVAPGSSLADLDCREAAMPRAALFDPAYVRAMSGYGVIRFKDWQATDANAPRRWDDRPRPGGTEAAAGDGVPIEDMLELSRATGADPWFSMPWNADAAYVRAFAQLVHDHLAPGRKVYVELANEVWNWSYPVTTQASKEGLAEHLTTNGGDAVMLRLAEKTVQVMKPWEAVFADRPRQLVRVIAAQHGNTYATNQLFAFPGLAAHVDALASAPYFGLDVKPAPGDAMLDGVFHDLDAAVDTTLDQALQMKAIAYRHGKRYIAYEAGQHLLVPDLPLARRIQRDPRMYLVYQHYLRGWRARVGDVLALYHTSSPIDGSGAWGLVEHDNQPLSETPKLRAVREAQAERR